MNKLKKLFSIKNLPLKYKVMGSNGITNIITLFAVCIAFVIYDRYTFKENIIKELHQEAEIIGQNNVAAIKFLDASTSTESINSLKSNPYIINAAIYTSDNKLFASFQQDSSYSFDNINVLNTSAELEDNKILEIFHPIIFNNNNIGTVYLSYDLTIISDRLIKFSGIVFLVFILASILGVLISLYFQGFISKPILRLTKVVKRISENGNYSVKLSNSGSDELSQLIASFNDMINKIKTQNEELVKSKEIAEQSVKAKEQFLANMSHEVRTPMNGIIGLSKLALKTKSQDKQLGYIRGIVTSSKNLLVVINDILDISKMDANKMTFEAIEFNLSNTLSSVVELLLPKAVEKNIKITKNIAKDIPKTIIGDPTRLTQILLNLGGNAIKFTKKGQVNFKIEKLEESHSKVKIQFQIEDTGIGIAADKLDSIFKSFEQASTNTTREYGGTGLGLAISKKLIELQKGHISVKSTLEVGTTFTFYITYLKHHTEDDKKTIAKIDQNELSIENANILLVEDNPINQLVAKETLDAFKANTTIAENGIKAIELFAKNDFDIILMDIQMPEMDGYEASQKIRKTFEQPKKDIPIIAMTAHAIEGEKERCIKAGMDDIITKPFDEKQLQQKIQQLIK